MDLPNRVSVTPWAWSQSMASSFCLTTPPGGESSLCSESRFSRQVTWPCEHAGVWLLSACNSVSFNMNCTPSFPLVEETDSPLSRDWRQGSPRPYLEASWEEQLLEQQEHLEKEMEEAKKMISGLQVALSLVVWLWCTNFFLFFFFLGCAARLVGS